MLSMTNRKIPLTNGEFYHVYNRGVDKRNIFSDKEEMFRFLQSMDEFNVVEPIGSLYENSFRLGGSTAKSKDKMDKKVQHIKQKNNLVNFIAYCLNPNHYHFILEQVVDGGISEFMKRLSGGYTWYFNNKHKRNGALFQGRFKAIHVESNEYLLHLSSYVNLNDHVHQLGGSTAKLVKSETSWSEYIEKKGSVEEFCKKETVLEQFKNKKEYKAFARESLKGILEKRYELDNLENLLLE